MPIAFADSMTAGSNSRRPTTVLRMTGSSAYSVRATIEGPVPRPSGVMSRPNSAYDGIVSSSPAAPSTAARGAFVRYVRIATGTPMSTARASPSRTSRMCASVASSTSGQLPWK